MNIPRERTLIPLQNETLYNAIAQKMTIQLSSIEKLFIRILLKISRNGCQLIILHIKFSEPDKPFKG